MNGISNSSMIGMGTSHMNKTSTLGNINNMRDFKNQNQQNVISSVSNYYVNMINTEEELLGCPELGEQMITKNMLFFDLNQ